jgi:hypothetical protein
MWYGPKNPKYLIVNALDWFYHKRRPHGPEVRLCRWERELWWDWWVKTNQFD